MAEEKNTEIQPEPKEEPKDVPSIPEILRRQQPPPTRFKFIPPKAGKRHF
jgi:hypothetical protein